MLKSKTNITYIRPILVQMCRTGNRIHRKCQVYIGPFHKKNGWSLNNSDWYVNCKDKNTVMKILKNKIEKLKLDLNDLTGKILGCTCMDMSHCHGIYLIRLWEEKFPIHTYDNQLYHKIFPKKRSLSQEKTNLKKKQKLNNHPVMKFTEGTGLKNIPWPKREPEEMFTVYVDEAGKGALAGPLSIGGVLLTDNFQVKGIHDSKILTPTQRKFLYEQIQRHKGVIYHIEHMSNVEIDQLGIDGAWHEGIRRVLKKINELKRKTNIEKKITHVCVDGNKHVATFDQIKSRVVIGGDHKIYGIATASILAKVSRDNIMSNYSKNYPGFEKIFGSSKGYGSPEHMKVVKEGVYTDLHRKCFNPLKSFLRK